MSPSNAVELLLVEDNPQDLELAVRALRKANLSNHIQIARDGAEALEYVFCEGPFAARKIEDGPKVILLDLKLPIKSGFDVLQWLRQTPGLAALRVVVVSGSELETDLARARSLGVIDYLVKPTSPARLAQLVSERHARWLGLGE